MYSQGDGGNAGPGDLTRSSHFSVSQFRVSLLLAAVLALSTACPPPEPADAGPSGDGDGDGDGNDIVAVITGEELVRLGEPLALSAADTENPDGRALTYTWLVDSEPEPGCAGAFSPSATNVDVTLNPTCLGDYRFQLAVGTVAGTAIESATFFGVQVIRPENHIAVVAPVDVDVFRGFSVDLDGSASVSASEEALSYQWTASTDQPGCAAAFDDDTSVTPTFTADCAGAYDVTLTVSDSLTSSEDTVALTVLNSLVVSFGMVSAEPPPMASHIIVNLDEETVPDGRADEVTVELSATPQNDEVAPTITRTNPGVWPAEFDVGDVSPHGVYTLSAVASLDGVQTAEPADHTLNVPNAIPTIAPPVVPNFDVGQVVTATVAASDADGDTLTCTARLLASDGTDLPAPPSVTSVTFDGDNCTIVVDTTGATIGDWTLETSVDDGNGGVATSTGGFTPINEPPMFGEIPEPMAIGYTCSNNTCQTEVATLILNDSNVSDDSTPLDELTFDFELTSMPNGVSDVALTWESAGTVGVFNLSLARASLGAMADGVGNTPYIVTISATDTALPGQEIKTETATFALRVETAEPVFDSLPEDALEFAHRYENGTQTYDASSAHAWTFSDPEANLITSTATITSCPPPGCATSGISINATNGNDGTLTTQLSAPTIGAVVGTYGVTVEIVDADGKEASFLFSFDVGNTPPELNTLMAMPDVPHLYSNGEFSGDLPYLPASEIASDADNDPIFFGGLTFDCSEGSTGISSGGATTCGDRNVTVSQTNILVSTANASSILRTYGLSGTVSDGHETSESGPIHAWTVTDDLPVISNSFGGGSHSGHHRWLSGNRLEFETPISRTGAASDPNNDPMTPEVTIGGATGCTASTNWATNGTTLETNIDCPWNERDATLEITPRLNTAFGATNDTSFSASYLNRTPTIHDIEFRMPDGSEIIYDINFNNTMPKLLYTQREVRGGAYIYQQERQLIDTGFIQAAGWTSRFAAYVDATDPDGDPLRVLVDFDCGQNTVRVPEFSCNGLFCSWSYSSNYVAPLATDGIYYYALTGNTIRHDLDCPGPLGSRYTEIRENGFDLSDTVTCSVIANTSYATDTFDNQQINWAGVESFVFEFEETPSQSGCF